jgi:hypothetical protein
MRIDENRGLGSFRTGANALKWRALLFVGAIRHLIA